MGYTSVKNSNFTNNIIKREVGSVLFYQVGGGIFEIDNVIMKGNVARVHATMINIENI